LVKEALAAKSARRFDKNLPRFTLKDGRESGAQSSEADANQLDVLEFEASDRAKYQVKFHNT
jgi:hypothetical protein